jgi:PAS domain S-box-containing protein
LGFESICFPSSDREPGPDEPAPVRHLSRLIDAVQELSLARDLNAVMAVVRLAARELTDADGATFVLRDGDKCFYAEENAIEPLWKGQRFPLDACVSGWAMLNRQAAVIEDIYTDARVPIDAYRPTFVRSMVMVPIRTREPLGAIGNYWAAQHRPSAEELSILQALADTTAVALENVQMYAELERRVRNLSALMQTAPVGILSLDRGGQPVTWNPAAAELFGLEPAQALGSGRPGIASESLGAYENVLESAIAEEASSDLRLKGRHSNGSLIDIHLSGAPLRDETGTPNGVLLVLQDETKGKELERQLLQAQKMEAVGQLTGGIAHDFNNLLGILIGNLDLIRERLESDAGTVKLVETALDAAMRGAELNKRLLTFSRRQTLQPEHLDANAALAATVKLLRRSLGERIVIHLEPGEDLWAVNADRVQLETAVLNLCINARDAMPEGGTLTIETQNAVVDREYAASHVEITPGDYVVVAVSDTGAGMKPEVLARVFEPFYTTKPVGAGTGLGLSMVYGFVKQSGGHVNIYSEEGKGTTVRLYLPRSARGEAGSRMEGQQPEVAAAQNELVLVVEDNELMRQTVVRQIGDLGYRTEEADTADTALAKIEAGLRPDLVFMDVVMPGKLGGIELAELLRGRLPHLPVLLTSGFTARAAMNANNRGAAGIGFPLISKPYRKAELARALKNALDSTARLERQ